MKSIIGEKKSPEALAEEIQEWKKSIRSVFGSWTVSFGTSFMVVSIEYHMGLNQVGVSVNSKTILECVDDLDAARVAMNSTLDPSAYFVRSCFEGDNNEQGMLDKTRVLVFGTNCKEDAVRVAEYLSKKNPEKAFYVDHFRRTFSKSVNGVSDITPELEFYSLF